MLKGLDVGVNKENCEQQGCTEPQEFHFAIVTAWAGVRKTARVKHLLASSLWGAPDHPECPQDLSKKFIRSD